MKKKKHPSETFDEQMNYPFWMGYFMGIIYKIVSGSAEEARATAREALDYYDATTRTNVESASQGTSKILRKARKADVSRLRKKRAKMEQDH